MRVGPAGAGLSAVPYETGRSPVRAAGEYPADPRGLSSRKARPKSPANTDASTRTCASSGIGAAVRRGDPAPRNTRWVSYPSAGPPGGPAAAAPAGEPGAGAEARARRGPTRCKGEPASTRRQAGGGTAWGPGAA